MSVILTKELGRGNRISEQYGAVFEHAGPNNGCGYSYERNSCSSFIWLVNWDGDEVTDSVRAVVQSVSHRPLTAEARVQFLVVPCEICEIQSEAETGFSPSLVWFCCVSIISPMLHTQIITDAMILAVVSVMYWRTLTNVLILNKIPSFFLCLPISICVAMEQGCLFYRTPIAALEPAESVIYSVPAFFSGVKVAGTWCWPLTSISAGDQE